MKSYYGDSVKFSISVFLLCILFNFQCLAQHKNFTIASSEFPPYTSISDSKNNFILELTKAAMEYQGYQVSLVILPWARAENEVEFGRFDAIPTFETLERKNKFTFTDELTKVEIGFYKLKNRDIVFSELDSLSSHNIGTVRGSYISKEFNNSKFLTKTIVVNDIQNIKMLLKGRIDLFTGAKHVIHKAIDGTLSKEQLNKIEFIHPPLKIHNYYLGVSKRIKGYNQKIEDFNRGLEKIKSDGTYELILKKHGLSIL